MCAVQSGCENCAELNAEYLRRWQAFISFAGNLDLYADEQSAQEWMAQSTLASEQCDEALAVLNRHIRLAHHTPADGCHHPKAA